MGKFDDYINVTAPIHSATIKGKLGNANEIFTENDEDNIQNVVNKTNEHLKRLDNRSSQMEESIKNISVTGGASVAEAVTYDNTTSGLEAVNVKGAVDELAAKNKSQDVKISAKAEKSDVQTSISELKEKNSTISAELAKKFNSENIAQEFGDSEDKVVSQFAIPFREIDSPEFLHCIVDSEDHFLFGIQIDGSIEWGKGIPAPIRKRIEEIVSLVNQKLTDMDTAFNAVKQMLSASITNLQDTKVDKEEGKSLIEDEVKECFKVIENEEFIYAIIDSDYRLLFGIYRATGKPYYPFNETYHVVQNEEFFAAWLDADNHILLGIRRDGQIIGYIKELKKIQNTISLIQKNIISLQNKTEELNEGVSSVNKDIVSIKSNMLEVPSYYDDYLKERIDVIDNTFLNYTSYNDYFIFITDLHLSTNFKKSPFLIEYLLKNTIINKVFCGGDIPIAYGSKESLVESALLFERQFYKKIAPYGKLFCIEGNHDFTIRTSEEINEGYTFPMQFSRNMYMSRMTNYNEIITNTDKSDSLYYYIDNKGQKLRYIVLNTTDSANDGENPWGVLFTFGKEQSDWVAKVIKNTPKDYKIIFLMHVPPITPQKVHWKDTFNFISAVSLKKEVTVNDTLYDFTNCPDVIMCLSGHMHRDECTYANGMLWVDTACDASYNNYKGGLFGQPDDFPSKYKGGDIYEQTFDCIGIDVYNKKVDMIRIGGGYDRTYHYNVIQLQVNSSTQLVANIEDATWMICDNIGNTLNSDIWSYSKKYATISENGLVQGITEGYAIACAKNQVTKKMEFFGINIING